MGLKSLMQYLQKPVTDTPDTSEKSMGYQCKAPIHAGFKPSFNRPQPTSIDDKDS